MPLIPENILDEVQSRTDIAELIGRFIPLKRAGRHFKALCPFHQERTPSFHINTDKQIFHCFGCSSGGNVFGFLMQHERLTFPEAVAQLAEQAGVELPRDAGRARDGRQEQLREVTEKACRFYERLLAHPQHGKTARAYLKTRGVTEETCETFRIGCAADGWDHLARAAARTGSGGELLREAGLTVPGKRGPIDRFRSRLLFPIQDTRGRVLGFGGRSLAAQEPKYLNSPETPIYSKGRQLFGLPQAKDELAKSQTAIIVEGYFDCVLLWQSGIRNVVSPLGTALTPEQARLLARYARDVVLAFDADAAGEQAALRGLEVLLEHGFHVRVAGLPPGVDPDEVVVASGAEAFRQLAASSSSVVEFLMAAAAKRADLRTPEGKAQAAQFVLPVVARVPDAVLRAEYARTVARRWVLDEAAVFEMMARGRGRGPGERAAHAQRRLAAGNAEKSPPLAGAERLLAALIVDDPRRWDRIKGEPVLDAVRDARVRRLLSAVSELRATSVREPTLAQVVSRLTEEGLGSLVSEVAQLAQTVTAKEAALDECVRRLIAEAARRRRNGLLEQIRQVQQAGNAQELTQLLQTFQQLSKDVPSGKAGG